MNRPPLFLSPIARPLAALLGTALLAGALGGCATALLGGAAVGSMVAMDRRTSGAQLEDEGIELRAASRIRDAMGERSHVNITSYNRQVLLTGEVPSERDKQQAEQIVARVENVRGVVNELAVMANTTLAQRSSDTLVTGKVRASLVDDRILSVGAFKVVTERGTTYLMGLVTPREAERATQLARTVSGVQRVVRIFELIGDDDVRRLAPATAPASPPPGGAARPPAQ